MNFSEKLDALQQRVVDAKTAIQTATGESREQLKHRIDKAQGDADQAVRHAEQETKQAAAGARTKWAQLKAEVAAKTGDAKAKIEERGRQLDAKAAAHDADWAEAEAADALDFATWAVGNAEVAILDAVDARLHADERAEAASL
jgi:hypothetical protein